MVFVPVLWNYDSRQAGGQQFSDDAAVCFYTDAAGQRVRHYWNPITNITVTPITVEVVVPTDWNAVISVTNYPAQIVVSNDAVFASITTNKEPRIFVFNRIAYNVFRRPIGTTNGVIEYKDRDNGDLVYRSENTDFTLNSWAFFLRNSTTWGYVGPYNLNFENTSVDAPDKTSAAVVYQTNINISAGGSIRTESGGAAYAIEVYPTKTHPHFKDFKPWDSGVRWVAMLHNGSNFYSNAETGEPVLFEVRKDWIQKIPDEGQW